MSLQHQQPLLQSAVFIVNENVAIQRHLNPNKGLGIFSRQYIEPGLRVFEELALVHFQSREQVIYGIMGSFHSLSAPMQNLLEKIYGGQNRSTPAPFPSTLSTPSAQDHAIRIQLELFARLNSVDVFGGGFVIGVASSALNHA